MTHLLDELRRFIEEHQTTSGPLPESTAPSISPVEMLILDAIIDHPGAVGSLIVNKSGAARSGVYVMLNRLEDKGLISSSTENGCRQYYATALGQRLYRAELVCRAARMIASKL